MTSYEELLRKMRTGEAKVLKSIPAQIGKAKPNVSSIYDTFSFKGYRNLPVFYLFKYDIGLMEWAIKNLDDFCIKEYDYLPQLYTVNKKMFEMSHVQHETMQNYENHASLMSGEEMLAAFGSEKYFKKLDVQNENSRKLQKFGIEKAEPKMMDRTYLCINRKSFPKLSNHWIYEKTVRSAKETANIIFFRSADEEASYASEFINKQIALFDFEDFYAVLDEHGNNITDSISPQEGDVFEATTNSSGDTRYTFKKIK